MESDRTYPNLVSPDVRDSELLITNTTDDNASCAIIRLDRESASPAADDNIGRINFCGRNAAVKRLSMLD